MKNLTIVNARVVTPELVIENGCVLIKDGKICDIGDGTDNRAKGSTIIDAQGMWLLPGIIDIHNDAIEKEIEPRPDAFLPLEIAMFSLENRLFTHGVTSIYHSLSFINGVSGVRKHGKIISNVEGINRLKKSGLIRHFIHARYEITEKDFCQVLIELMEKGNIQLLSFMDHTPGQGQYKKIEVFEEYTEKSNNIAREEVKKIVKDRIEKSKDKQILEFMNLVAQKAKQLNIPIASHDDDSPDKVRFMKNKGVTISEFPINIESAQAAVKEGQHVVIGAPNIIRGFSNSGNMRAIDAVQGGSADILCSDYAPASILHAIYILHYKYGIKINEAVKMASVNAAKAVGVDEDLGSIELGKQADLILVREMGGIPFVEQMLVGGKSVFKIEKKRQAAG